MVIIKNEINKVPVWWYNDNNDSTVTGNDSLEGNKLIKEHVDKCGSLLQIDNIITKDKKNVHNVIESVKKMGLTPIFIHVYPEDNNYFSTLSIYIKENINKLENKK
ncbi:hypothetical protein [Acidithiobacillus sp.]|uniref:hypothetical protein n=1 Tax=Acidithiobacillus sp. TaxID=1872118 RepID=UPI003562CB71